MPSLRISTGSSVETQRRFQSMRMRMAGGRGKLIVRDVYPDDETGEKTGEKTGTVAQRILRNIRDEQERELFGSARAKSIRPAPATARHTWLSRTRSFETVFVGPIMA